MSHTEDKANNQPLNYHYEYPKADNTSSVIPYIRETESHYRVLMITRGREPFKGKLALAGGFQEVKTEKSAGESLVQTAARELYEETGISMPVAKFYLVDVQSNPERDTRNKAIQVIDHVYAVPVPLEKLLSAAPGDDAASLELITIDLAWNLHGILPSDLTERIAFDHADSIHTWVRMMRRDTTLRVLR